MIARMEVTNCWPRWHKIVGLSMYALYQKVENLYNGKLYVICATSTYTRWRIGRYFLIATSSCVVRPTACQKYWTRSTETRNRSTHWRCHGVSTDQAVIEDACQASRRSALCELHRWICISRSPISSKPFIDPVHFASLAFTALADVPGIPPSGSDQTALALLTALHAMTRRSPCMAQEAVLRKYG